MKGLAMIAPVAGGRILSLAVVAARPQTHSKQDAAIDVVLTELFEKALDVFILIAVEDSRNIVADMIRYGNLTVTAWDGNLLNGS